MKSINKYIVEKQQFLVKGHTIPQRRLAWVNEISKELQLDNSTGVLNIKGRRVDSPTNKEHTDISKIKFKGWVKIWIFVAEHPGLTLLDIIEYCNEHNDMGNYSKGLITTLTKENILSKENNKYYANHISKWNDK